MSPQNENASGKIEVQPEVSVQTSDPSASLASEAGIFTLEPSGTDTADSRPGASLAAWGHEDSVGLENNDIELPMVVWLRGDEPWYPQFDLDADAVMARL